MTADAAPTFSFGTARNRAISDRNNSPCVRLLDGEPFINMVGRDPARYGTTPVTPPIPMMFSLTRGWKFRFHTNPRCWFVPREGEQDNYTVEFAGERGMHHELYWRVGGMTVQL